MVALKRLFQPIVFALAPLMLLGGCGDDIEVVREIQSQRQSRSQSQSQQDHLGEAFSLLSRLIELNSDEARRQIVYHLNRWQEDKSFDTPAVTQLVRSVSEVLPPEAVAERIERASFTPGDVDHLRDSYLFREVFRWIDSPASDDPLLTQWLQQMESQLSENEMVRLRTATRLFDWTVRNVAYEPKQPTDAAPPAPPMSQGMQFRGPGYRQTNYQTVFRGTGDALQRAGVFIQLCRQASIPAFVLATQSADSGELNPWAVGILVGQQIYLFEPDLGTFVPGPDQVGIATLAEARSDAAVMRRLNVPGFFDYPLDMADVQQCIALLSVVPEAISPRMANLESGLTGDRRMNVYVDADALAAEIDAVSGIAGVRLWNVPMLAEIYQQDLAKAATRDPLFAFWYFSRWAIMEAPVEQSQQLALARWRHLQGQFDRDEEADTEGARVLYLGQRAPEFEIAKLRIDVDLQMAYGIRRELGTESEVYDRQVQQAQEMMRSGKRTATYWISLIQYDDQRYDTAQTWFEKRVLDVSQTQRGPLDVSVNWEPAARYNLARAKEQLGLIDEATALYKTDGDPQEHGNRIRARLLSKSTD